MGLKYRDLVLSFILTVFLATSCTAEEATPYHTTRESIVEMVEKAATAIQKHGFPLAVSSVPEVEWVRPITGVYIFVMDPTGMLLLHPNQGLEGRNIVRSKDRNGVGFIREILFAVAEDDGRAWINYDWVDPTDGEVKRKKTYSARVGDVIISAGYFDEEI